MCIASPFAARDLPLGFLVIETEANDVICLSLWCYNCLNQLINHQEAEMIEQNESILKNLRDIQSLRGLLKSEASISDPQEGKVIATIKVYNDAPVSPDGGDIVFLGVGLRIIIGSEEGMQRGSAYWLSRISKSRPSDNTELRRKYNEGTWFGSREGKGSFPEVTSDEQSHGEVLFPGESVVYEMKTSEAELPYLDIRVEGSVSRRHLLHISQPMEALKHWSQPFSK
jgi:hypothetical protein